MNNTPVSSVSNKSLLDLVAELNRVTDVKMFQKTLSTISARLISDKEISHALLLAEDAVRWKQWLAAAQLYLHVAVLAFEFDDEDGTLVVNANYALFLSNRRNIKPKTKLDIACYSFKRLFAALAREGIHGTEAVNWFASSLKFISRNSESKKNAVTEIRNRLLPKDWNTGDIWNPHLGTTAPLILRALCQLDTSETNARNEKSDFPKRNLAILLFGIIASAAISWMLRSTVQFPQSSILFEGSNVLGFALLLWTPLLVLTWIFAFFEAKQTHTLREIHPKHLISKNTITTGEIMPFLTDWFFHVFQFVWVPLLIISLVLMAQYETLQSSALELWASSMPQNASPPKLLMSLNATYIPSFQNAANKIDLLRIFILSDVVSLLGSAGIALTFMANQVRIQNERIDSGINFYWWDKRVSYREWVVRLVMVGVDTFLGMFLIFKIVAITLVSLQLASTDLLSIQIFSPDGLGGMSFLMDIFKSLSWLVFLFGFFVIASVYLHWNLPEYRKTDAALFVGYLLLVALALLPLFLLDARLGLARDALVASLPRLSVDVNQENLKVTADTLRHIREIRNWEVSALSADLLKSPILPLAGQFVFAVVQFFFRESGGKKLSV